jgi:ribosomal subunit interface protein
MDITFTGRGVQVTDRVRTMATHKLAVLERMEPRAVTLEIELIGEHHPTENGVKRVEGALHIPRKTFRATAEADDLPTAVDRMRDKLERQLRDHHGKKKPPKTAQPKGAVGYADTSSAEAAEAD